MKFDRILVTGAAGFIGMHTARNFCKTSAKVTGVDNFSDYYDPQFKHARISYLEEDSNFSFKELDLADKSRVETLFQEDSFDLVIHLAAQPGIRYSLVNPGAYIESNLVAFGHILEGVRQSPASNLIYASSSSVYGRNKVVPFSESHDVNLPANLYAATKRSNELLAETYNYLFGMRCTGLRFFTVYGPWGRPDMAYFKFTKLLFAGEPLPIFNRGNHRRDMTYIDDIMAGIRAAAEHLSDDHKIYNLGNSKTVELIDMVHELEQLTGRVAKLNFMPIQEGDIVETYADIDAARTDLNFSPKTEMATGLAHFIDWYRDYFNIQSSE